MKRDRIINKAKTVRKKSKKQAVLMLAAATFVVWLLLIFIKLIVSHRTGNPVDFSEIFDGVLDNILGILPPIILIDFAFEAATQDFVSEEISEQITSTLMSNADTIRLFDDETKLNFLNATISTMTIHGENETSMAINAIAPYIKSQYNLRKHFDYGISLWNYPPHSTFEAKDYIMVCETLRYEKQYISSEILNHTFRIGFFTQNKELDRHLRKNDYLFREALSIHPHDLKKLICLSAEEKLNFVTNEMVLKVFIDHTPCQIESVFISDIGIDVIFSSTHNRNKDTIYVDATFCMPQLRTQTTFLVSIVEPTYGIDIRLSYPHNVYNVTMFPFFNDVQDALVDEADRGVGNCDIHIREKWVYPISGIVFIIDTNSSENTSAELWSTKSDNLLSS